MMFLAVFTVFATEKSAKATEPADTFEMVQGAQVKLTGDGVRFIVKMGSNVYDRIVTDDAGDDVELHVYIAPKSLFDATSGDYSALSKKVDIKIDESLIYSNGGYFYANAVLTNLNAANNDNITVSQFDYDFVGVGVILEDGETPVFADFFEGNIENNMRSQYGLLQSVVFDDKSDAFESLLSIGSPYASWFRW